MYANTRTTVDQRDFANAAELLAAVGELVETSGQHPTTVYVRCYSGDLHDVGRAYLIEEQLTDGSKVFNIELEPAPVAAREG